MNTSSLSVRRRSWRFALVRHLLSRLPLSSIPDDKPYVAGAEALTAALPHCKKLVVLEMLCCGLGDEGARSLAKNLPSYVAVFSGTVVCACLAPTQSSASV